MDVKVSLKNNGSWPDTIPHMGWCFYSSTWWKHLDFLPFPENVRWTSLPISTAMRCSIWGSERWDVFWKPHGCPRLPGWQQIEPRLNYDGCKWKATCWGMFKGNSYQVGILKGSNSFVLWRLCKLLDYRSFVTYIHMYLAPVLILSSSPPEKM